MGRGKRQTRQPRKTHRSKRTMTYHGRTGKPEIHYTKSGRQYIMVRARGGGRKRLYLEKGNVPKKHREAVKHRR